MARKMTEPVEVIISTAEYECSYDWDWTEVEYETLCWNREKKEWEPCRQRLDTKGRDVYQISADMYQRWLAVRDGFDQVQEDIRLLNENKPLPLPQSASQKGLPW
jgi:hypothetical protein